MNDGAGDQSEAQPWKEQAVTIQFLDADHNIRSLAEIEAEAISLAIRHHRGNMSSAAISLGIGRSTLYRKIKDPSYDFFEDIER